MKTAIITTTINVPNNLRRWGEQLGPNDVIVVAGDQKTPHNDVYKVLEDIGCETRYLHPIDQIEWMSSTATGWNCIQRRNIALLEALRFNPDIIITVDDDNVPTRDNHVQRVRQVLDGQVTTTTMLRSWTRWYNVGVALSPPVVVRGFPLDRRHDHPDLNYVTGMLRTGVLASLWLGDPDIDAVTRICHDPQVTDMVSPDVVLAPGTWCPFNSQATAYRRELAPLMMVWPGVGRYDDIWASYLAQRVMEHLGWVVRFGNPLVRQERNPHNLVRDLDQEMYGYRHTGDVTAALRDVTLTTTDVIECLRECFTGVRSLTTVPRQTSDSWMAWLEDLTTLTREKVNFT